MTDFKAKMHQIRFRLWGLVRGRVRGWAGEEEVKGEGKGKERKWRGKGRAPSYC